jgi:hypothetical protein
MTKYYLGIDPGANGGLCWGSGDPDDTYSAAMPDTMEGVYDLIEKVSAQYPNITAALEEVGGYVGGAGQPGSRMFKFGRGVGNVETALYATGVPTIQVRPQRWQGALKLGNSKLMTKTQWKNKIKGRVKKVFPKHKITLKTSDAFAIYLAHSRNLI